MSGSTERIGEEPLTPNQLTSIQNWVDEAGDDEWDEFRLDIAWIKGLLATIERLQAQIPPEGVVVLVPKKAVDVEDDEPWCGAPLIAPAQGGYVYVEWKP